MPGAAPLIPRGAAPCSICSFFGDHAAHLAVTIRTISPVNINSWRGSYENVAALVPIGVNSVGDREVIGYAEGHTESADSSREFFSRLKGRGLSGVRLVTGDKCAGMLGALEEVFPGARHQRRTVHFYRNVLGRVPVTRRKAAARMLKAIHAQESREACSRKVADELDGMRFGAAARTVRDGFAETLAYADFPPEHWRRIRTNNGIERINWEIGRRTRVVGTFPDGNSALILVTARLKCVVEHEWGKRRYLDMSKLEEMDELKGKVEGKKRTGPRTAKSICERILTVPFLEPVVVVISNPRAKAVFH